MQFTAPQIALMLQGKIEGDATAVVQSFGKIEEAVAGQLSFLANPKYEEYLYTTHATIVIVQDTLQLTAAVTTTLIRVTDPYAAFAMLMTKYQELSAPQLSGIEQPCYIAPSAIIGHNVYIGAFAYIGDGAVIGDGSKIYPSAIIGNQVKIGNNTTIHAGVKIYADCIIGNQVIIHAGAVLGSDGFGFAPLADGSYNKVPQLGNVVVNDWVEIGANTTIDRATMGSTIIQNGVKLDNLVQIAHNVNIGINTVIAAQTGVSGSSKIGKNVQIGGQAGVAGHISIADGSKINGKSGVTKTIKEPNKSFNGNPAFDFSASMRVHAMSRNLPDLEKRVKELEKMVQELLSKRVNS